MWARRKKNEKVPRAISKAAHENLPALSYSFTHATMNDDEERQRLAPSSSSGDNEMINIGSGVSIDACLDAIGIGPLQWSVAENHVSFSNRLLVAINTSRRYIVLVAGLANASDGIEILMVSDV